LIVSKLSRWRERAVVYYQTICLARGKQLY
jgi:hypothetical protein